MAFHEIELRRANRPGCAPPGGNFPPALVECMHQLDGGHVIHAPETDEDGAGAGCQKSGGNAGQFIAAADRAETGLAAAENNKFSRIGAGENIGRGEPAIGKAKAGAVRRIAEKFTVAGDVGAIDARELFQYIARRRIAAEQYRGRGRVEDDAMARASRAIPGACSSSTPTTSVRGPAASRLGRCFSCAKTLALGAV